MKISNKAIIGAMALAMFFAVTMKKKPGQDEMVRIAESYSNTPLQDLEHKGDYGYQSGRAQNEQPYVDINRAYLKTLTGYYDNMCNNPFSNPNRYFYNVNPPTKNGSYDIRAFPTYIGQVSKNYGIFKQTDIFGNQRDQRICPSKYKTL